MHNRILFRSDAREGRALCIIDPTGENGWYLRLFAVYANQVGAIRERERLSPNRRCRLSVGETGQREQITQSAYMDLKFLKLGFFCGMLGLHPAWPHC